MKHLKYVLIVSLISIAVLSIINSLYKIGYKKFYQFEQDKLEEVIKGKKDFDVLFVGSSRTFYHINPRVIDSVLNLQTFNAGIDGANLLEMNMIIKAYLNTGRKPNLIVLDISPPAFDIDLKPIFNPNIYYPYLDNDIIFQSIKPYRRVYLLKNIPFLRLTEADDALKQASLYGLLNKKSVAPIKTYKGFKSNGNDTLPYSYKRIKALYDIDSNGIELLNEIIQVCAQFKTKLVLTYAPHYKLLNEEINPRFFPTIQQASQLNHIPFLNYRYHPISQQHTLFEDVRHLNKNGADLYSAVIANDIKPLL